MNKSISKLAKEDPEVLQRRKERFLALEIKESQSNPASPTKQKRTKSDSSSNIAQSSNKKAKKDQAKKTLRIPEGQHQGDARALIQKQQANKQAHLPQRIIGKSSALDKQYLRLTSEVDPHTVRPISVLKASLAKVTSTYHSNHDYEEACDQLRSIRQDLTVQGIANPFTVQIYELHARLALENGDICQYQQCSAKLLDLRIANRKNLKKMKIDEFDCYRLLYAYSMDNQLEIAEIMKDIERHSYYSDENSATHFALMVIKALKTGNLYRFFRLYALGKDGKDGNIVVVEEGDQEKQGQARQGPPYHSMYLLQTLLDKTRNAYLKYIVSSFQTYPLLALPNQLAIQSHNDNQRHNGRNGDDKADIKAIVSLMRENRILIKGMSSKISSSHTSEGADPGGKDHTVTATTAEIDCIATREYIKRKTKQRNATSTKSLSDKSDKSDKKKKKADGKNDGGILSRLGVESSDGHKNVKAGKHKGGQVNRKDIKGIRDQIKHGNKRKHAEE